LLLQQVRAVAGLIRSFSRIQTLLLIYLHMVFFSLCLRPVVVPSAVGIVASLVCMASCYINATAVNDLTDEATDAINLANDESRPLIAGSGSRRQVQVTAGVAAAVCLATALIVAPWVTLVAVVMLGLNIVYSVPPMRVSGRGALAQALLPLEYCAFPALVVAGLFGRMSIEFVLVIVMMWLIFTGRLFLKDIRDEAGDRATGKRTFTVRHGAHQAIIQSAVWTATGTLALSVVMFVSYDANPWFVFGFCALSVSGQLWALHQCDRAAVLPVKLLYTGVYGRWISLKVFFYVVVMALAMSHVTLLTELLILGVTVVMVISNIAMLYQNIDAKRLATRGPATVAPAG